MTVGDLFLRENITQDRLVNVWDISDYWQSSYAFVMSKWDQDVEFLTPKQYQWLDKILDDAIELKIEKKI